MYIALPMAERSYWPKINKSSSIASGEIFKSSETTTPKFKSLKNISGSLSQASSVQAVNVSMSGIIGISLHY